ncbi:hypothetical protein [Peribacillus frigoritolerans]|uniref:hypothetical protein n=1 Tax=Peribacillus frigoritolerans TaxID=450367 RepID=UPI001059F0B7|nr:hypothetical protein [Peribacillus frigoritolerans]TDL76156.1 hypothetical protein E2R53_20910 [Peribacillus frigoritolerans]
MKKLLAAALLLLGCLMYLIFALFQSELYLPHFSVEAVNPISLDWNNINIDTKFQDGEPGSVYRIWLTPIYGIVCLSLVLIALSFRRKNT